MKTATSCRIYGDFSPKPPILHQPSTHPSEETKLEKIESSVCRVVWNSDDFEWVMQKSNGTSGGLLCIWNKRNFVKRSVVEGHGFIGMSGEWGKKQLKCTFVNVYAPCDRQSRFVLWGELSRLVLEEGGRWLLAGDFNVVRNSAERKGRMGETQDMEEFNLFVQGTGLVDVRLRNRKYTWYRPDGTSMSRLDRFLLSTEMSLMEGDWIQEGIRRWNDRVFGNVEIQSDNLRNEIERLDKKGEVEGLNAIEVKMRREAFHELWDTLKKRESVWKQKSRANWAQLGDANSTFFHRSVHVRRAQNTISGVYGDEGWVKEPELIKSAAVKYFSKVFQNEQWCQPTLDGIQFRRISDEQREWLERPFTIEEIEEGLKDCDGSKAPGPDGFNFNFIKFAWSTVKDDFVNFLMDFHRNGSESQAAFIGGRQLVESVLVLNEVVHEWREWMWECLSTTRISILINGSPTSEFPVSNGLRQGDPLSPFLFLLVAEGLSGLVKKAEGEGLLKGVAIGRGGMVLSLLQFSDDTVFMGKADVENLRVVKAILNCWEYMCVDKGRGGLGVADLERRNCSLLGKWWYRLGDGVDGLWKRVLWEKYYGGRKEVDVTSVVNWNMSGVWKDIMGLGSGSERLVAMLGEGFKWKVGNGSCVHFWHDKWVGDKPLRNLFPRLYALAIRRDGQLKDMGYWSAENWIWDCRWRRGCVGQGVGEEEQFRELINRVRLHKGEVDCWRWIHSGDGVYSAKKAYDFLSSNCCVLDEKWSRVLWGSYVPSKLSVFGWRLFLNRLATKDNLCRRGVALPGGNVLGWWGVQSALPNDVFGLADAVVAGINGGSWTDLGPLIFLVTACSGCCVYAIERLAGDGNVKFEGVSMSIEARDFY
ncbi:hypothetical protein SLEP1_g14096 [Rubroshorea leprosula]|uniref:Reverse transcriptase domain-containing protein n=1 Tax=Rubroshorea leprosula TaxID=152421 RepID=A0AAV5INS5_9ROSI|nr:hypothetical protein SLEP1_g14096 [Rubroshorea leprosula]